jgi:hypothetical protein
MLRLRTLAWLAALVVSAGVSCEGNPVGRECFIGTEVENDSQAILSSPALECSSRICLHQPLLTTLPEGGRAADQCTAECESDDDCDRVPESPCVKGFTCGVAVVVGPFCCRKFCICKDYVVVPDSGELATPAACLLDDSGRPQSSCCNLAENANTELCRGS